VHERFFAAYLIATRKTFSEDAVIDAATLLGPWDSFYVIVGSSGAALTGLQFVVMALIAEADRKGTSDAVSAFGTPTVVHFCVVLTTAAILSAPWQRTLAPSLILALVGIGGLAYIGTVTARARRQTVYKPVFEDWLWHSILPLLAYAMLLIGAIAVTRGSGDGLFAVAGTTLLLLLIGIHNSWDSVAYVATEQYNKHAPPTGRTPT
jgi:hypothetical protein